MLGVGHHSQAVRVRRKQRNDAARPLERQVYRFAEAPAAATVLHELLFGADAVNRQLQRARAIRRPSELVVDQTKGPILEQIDAVGLAAQHDRAHAVACGKRECAAQVVFEQPLDHGHRPLSLHPQDRLAQARSGGRSKEACSLQARFCHGQSLERGIDDRREQLARAIEIAGCDRPLTARLPRLEECFEHFVQEPALPLRIHHLFVFRFVFEPQHMLGEKLERTVQIGLERTDRQGWWGG